MYFNRRLLLCFVSGKENNLFKSTTCVIDQKKRKRKKKLTNTEINEDIHVRKGHACVHTTKGIKVRQLVLFDIYIYIFIYFFA